MTELTKGELFAQALGFPPAEAAGADAPSTAEPDPEQSPAEAFAAFFTGTTTNGDDHA